MTLTLFDFDFISLFRVFKVIGSILTLTTVVVYHLFVYVIAISLCQKMVRQRDKSHP